jgi:predicted nucleotidyltransferase
MDEAQIHRLREAAERAFAGHNVLAAYVYGSRISGRPRPDSDLDVGYYLDRSTGCEPLPLRIEMELAGSLSGAAGFTVDLRDLGDAPLELRGRVLEEGMRIYSGDPERRVALERDLLGRYHDYKDVFRNMHEIRLKQTAARGL